MLKIIGNAILDVKEIDRVEIVKRYKGFLHIRPQFDVEVRLYEPKNYQYASVKVDSFKGPGAIENATTLLTLIHQRIYDEKNKGSDEEWAIKNS